MTRVFIIFLFIFSAPIYAQNFGGFSCGKILAYERSNNEIQIDFVALEFVGYIGGRNDAAVLNAGKSEPYFVKFRDADKPTLFYLLVKHCKDNPTDYIGQAMRAIYEQGEGKYYQ
jgi:hypothetical protein